MTTKDTQPVNFQEDPEIHRQVKARCKELGITLKEYYQRRNRELLGIEGFDSPESMYARASELDNEAQSLEAEASDLEKQASLKFNEAERKRKQAEKLREEADSTKPYDEAVQELIDYVNQGDNRRLFAEHKMVVEAASEQNTTAAKLLNDVQEVSGLPDERFTPLNGD